MDKKEENKVTYYWFVNYECNEMENEYREWNRHDDDQVQERNWGKEEEEMNNELDRIRRSNRNTTEILVVKPTGNLYCSVTTEKISTPETYEEAITGKSRNSYSWKIAVKAENLVLENEKFTDVHHSCHNKRLRAYKMYFGNLLTETLKQKREEKSEVMRHRYVKNGQR